MYSIALKSLSIFSLSIFLLSINNTATNAQESSTDTIIVFETNKGTIELKLYPDIAPKTSENMIGLIKKGYYDGLIFHRVIKNFMIQGGDPTGTGRGGESLWGGKFEDETSALVTFDKKGLLAMANSGLNTNGSQFFITTIPTPWLNGKHTIFGEVISGYDIVQTIENTQVGAGSRPTEDQIILKAFIKE
ncbi:Peptidyl-prolyl cis-trans isomerase [hydrothermal vent metagenome]|uniref:peptidylprolyl isomerase n=1 Tax=hydrothermal vent metagenome TaxID=652676 RepID=A0A3B0TYR2_9ZZZZ